jgi:hypothetical protein
MAYMAPVFRIVTERSYMHVLGGGTLANLLTILGVKGDALLEACQSRTSRLKGDEMSRISAGERFFFKIQILNVVRHILFLQHIFGNYR